MVLSSTLLPQIWIVAFSFLLSLTIIFTHKVLSVDDHVQNPGMMNARNSPMDTGDVDGPTRKKSRREESSASGQFPSTLEDWKYKFNEKGQLRHITTGEPYKFEVERGNQAYNKRRYEALGKVVTQHIYKLLETETKLKKIYIPLQTSKGEPRSFVFISENALRTKDKLLVLINGSGAVRAGQWARRLIINDCLDSGTQIPYIKRALQNGYEVLVLNTNENRGLNHRGESVPIRGSSTAYEHSMYVWDRFVANRPVTRVAIVAHSMGGSVTAHIAKKREQSFVKKVFAIAFTDSVHNLAFSDVPHSVKKLFAKHSVNWVSSSKPLDTPLLPARSQARLDSRQVSAGTGNHAETSWTSIESVFTFLGDQEDRLAESLGQSKSSTPSLALTEEYDDGDDDHRDDDSVDSKDAEEGDGGHKDGSQDQDGSQRSYAPPEKTPGSARIDISSSSSSSSSDEMTEASFDFMRVSDEL